MFVFLILEDVLRYKWKILPSTVAIYSWMSLLHSPWTNNIESILEVIIAKALKILYLGKYFPCRLLLNMFFLQITWSFNLLFLNKEDHLCILWSWTFFNSVEMFLEILPILFQEHDIAWLWLVMKQTKNICSVPFSIFLSRVDFSSSGSEAR